MSSVVLGLSLVRERLRGLSAALVVLLSALALFAIGVLARQADAASAADDTLLGPVFGVAVPLLAYLLCERLCCGARLDRSVDTVARYGASRRGAVLGLLLGAVLCMALLSAVLSAVALLGARPQALRVELRSISGIGFAAGTVYALWFGAASLFGARGGGRKWALLVDFVLGAGSSVLALGYPRAHLRNLLGGRPALDWSQSRAWIALAVLGILYASCCLARTNE